VIAGATELEFLLVAALIVDPPPAASPEQHPAEGSAGAPGPAAAVSAPVAAAAAVHSCSQCGAPMAVGQDWCLQCGAGARGSIGTPSWRSAAAILGATAVLVLGAAGAGYAALSKRTHASTVTASVARTTTSAAVAPPATTPPASTPVPGTLGTPTTINPSVPLTPVKPPKIPLTATTPKTTATTPSATPTTPTPAGTGGASPSDETKPAAIVLDTNAASTYNPYSYPASIFGDPSLTIDGDSSTGWTAQVNPATAPSMAVGVLLSLHAKQKVASLELITSTPGMSVQIYGATGQTVPASITDPGWTPLSGYQVVKKRHVRMHLRDAKKAFTFVTLWISKAPADAVGTAEAPGRVSINEIELFPSS
jgi:hypothetical protein